MHKQVFGAVDGATYQNWFSARVREIKFEPDAEVDAVAYVDHEQALDVIHLAPEYIQYDHPQIIRVGVLFHEARHAEKNADWSHVDCPVPFMDDQFSYIVNIWNGRRIEGDPRCDVTALGANGVVAILMDNVAKFCTNCNEKTCLDSGLMKNDAMSRIIDQKAKQQLTDDFL